MDVTKTTCVTISSACLSFLYNHEKETGLQKPTSILENFYFGVFFSFAWHANKKYCYHWAWVALHILDHDNFLYCQLFRLLRHFSTCEMIQFILVVREGHSAVGILLVNVLIHYLICFTNFYYKHQKQCNTYIYTYLPKKLHQIPEEYLCGTRLLSVGANKLGLGST